MLPVETLFPFLIATSIFAFTPGPGMFYLAVQTMAHGAKAGWQSSVAFHLASYIHILMAAFGVTVLLTSAPVLLVILKLAGAGYLVLMGVRMFLRSSCAQCSTAEITPKPKTQAFRDSLTVEILNPKSVLFYFAFLPQFTSTDVAASIGLQILLLGIIANTLFSITDIACILAARLVASQTAPTKLAAHCGRKIGGGILIGMGVKVAVGNI